MGIDFSYLANLLLSPHQGFVKNGGSVGSSEWKRNLELFAQELRRFATPQGLDINHSWGIGRWAYFPWIRLAFPNASGESKKGVFIDYLFGWEDRSAYLTLLQGIDSEVPAKIQATKKLLQEKIPQGSFEKTPSAWNPVHGGTKAKQDRARGYAGGMIFHKLYTAEGIPGHPQLQSDLEELVASYRAALPLITKS